MPEVIIFTHVPKVAGTSALQRLAKGNISLSKIRRFRGVRDLALNRNEFSLLSGHSPYGIHHFITGDCRYFTMLRNPESRTLSHYWFIREGKPREDKGGNYRQKVLHNSTPLHEIFKKTRRKKYRLMGTWLIDNMQTRYLAGYWNYWRPATSTRLLSTAKRHLRENYATFGLQEHFEDSIQRIAAVFEWDIKEGGGEKLKRTANKEPLNERDRIAIARNNELYADLYDYAVELFRKRTWH